MSTNSRITVWQIGALAIGSLWLLSCCYGSSNDESTLNTLEKTEAIWQGNEADLSSLTAKQVSHAKQSIVYAVNALPWGALNKQGASWISLFFRYIPMKIEFFLCGSQLLPDFYKDMGEIAKSYGVGNCGEHTSIAFYYLKNKHPDLRIEFIADSENDHAYMVVERDPKSKLKDPSTWGPGAFICDAWARKIFLAKDLDIEMGKMLTTILYTPKALKKKSLHICDHSGTFTQLSS